MQGPFVPLPPAPPGPPPGGRETGWSGFALALRASGAILAFVLLAWGTLKLAVFRLATEADPGFSSAYYDEPTLGEYVRGSTLIGDGIVLALLLMADQSLRLVRRGLRATWAGPRPAVRALLVLHAALLAGAGFWLVHPVLWGTTLYF